MVSLLGLNEFGELHVKSEKYLVCQKVVKEACNISECSVRIKSSLFQNVKLYFLKVVSGFSI